MYRTNSLRRTGYLEIDHRDSPGIPTELAEQWKRMGVPVEAGSTRLQRETYSCGHCGVQVVKNPDRTRAREVCRRCMKVVCDNHVLWCRPFEQMMERVLNESLKLDSTTNLLLPAGRT